jgi:hypothetical protein
MNININITLDTWGLFEPFDGEVFESFEYIFDPARNKDYNWYIQTLKISKNEYMVYYVPTKRSLEFNPEETVRKIYVTKSLIIERLKKSNNFGSWNIVPNDEGIIEIDNFIWYYLGLAEDAGIMNEIKLNKSKKMVEVNKNISKFEKSFAL